MKLSEGFATKNIIILVVTIILFWGGRSTLHLASKSILGGITNCSMTAMVLFGEAPDLFERALLKFQALEWRVWRVLVFDVVLNLCCVGLVWLCWCCFCGGCGCGCGCNYWLEWIHVVLCWICVVLQEKCKTAKESVASNRRQRQEIGIPVLQLRLMEDIRWTTRDVWNPLEKRVIFWISRNQQVDPISSTNSISWCGVCKMSASLKRRGIFHLKEEVWKASW